MPSLEITALEHPEHSIAERPAAQAVDERVVGIGRPVLEDRGLPGTASGWTPSPTGPARAEPTEEKLELYRQAGWEYAFRVGRAYFLFYTTDPQAPELFLTIRARGCP